MRAGFLITTEQGQIRVDVTLAEWMRLGRREGRPVAEVAKAPSIETMIELIHWAAQRTGQTDALLDDFAATIIDIERVMTEDPKATKTARGNTSSSSSKSKPARTGQTTPTKTSSRRSTT